MDAFLAGHLESRTAGQQAGQHSTIWMHTRRTKATGTWSEGGGAQLVMLQAERLGDSGGSGWEPTYLAWQAAGRMGSPSTGMLVCTWVSREYAGRVAVTTPWL